MYCNLFIFFIRNGKLKITALKKKIRIEDLLHSSGSSYASAQNITSNLMNLVMQFRKVSNIFETIIYSYSLKFSFAKKKRFYYNNLERIDLENVFLNKTKQKIVDTPSV